MKKLIRNFVGWCMMSVKVEGTTLMARFRWWVPHKWQVEIMKSVEKAWKKDKSVDKVRLVIFREDRDV